MPNQNERKRWDKAVMRLLPRDREGRCYELAWKYQANDHRFVSWDLVHGEIVEDGLVLGHAWLVFGQQVYDPILDQEFSAADYLAKFKAKPIRRYARVDALRIGPQHLHFGPWDPWDLTSASRSQDSRSATKRDNPDG